MTKPGTGILLIAEPFLKDPNFMRSVVLLTEHHDEGTVGFVVNRQYENTLDELLPEMEGITLPVFYGGPVQKDTLHFLHRYPEDIPDGVEILPGVYWGGDFEALTRMLHAGEADPDKLRFYVGYSGWGAGQLDGEIDEKTWLTVPANRKLIFHPEVDAMWKDALAHLGGEYEMMKNFPIDPQLN